MKLIKFTAVAFVLSIFFATIGVSAGSVVGLEAKIPILSGVYISQQQTKSRTGFAQSFYSVTMSKPTLARTHGMLAGIGYSEWREGVENSEIKWTHEESKMAGPYQFQAKRKTSGLASYTYYVVWTYDPAM